MSFDDWKDAPPTMVAAGFRADSASSFGFAPNIDGVCNLPIAGRSFPLEESAPASLFDVIVFRFSNMDARFFTSFYPEFIFVLISNGYF